MDLLTTAGSWGLHLALVSAAVALVAGAIGGRTGSRRYATLAAYGAYTTFGLMSFGASIYLYSFLTHNFELQNVVRYSDTRMPIEYLMSAFWGGQAGSFLYWSTLHTSLTALAVFVHRKKDTLLTPWFIMVSMSLLVWFLFILLFKSNPFEVWNVLDAPKEGQGLNPLLQTPLMVMHPPSQLGGFASLGVPYSFTMAALLAGDFGTDWLRVTRKWALLSFLLLSIGNMLGGMWAYEELGWGGYWAWDPVENAAFMPWLAVVAWLHSIMVQERRGMLKRWNVVLMHLAFLLTLFGTFITRSGLIDSVHTFAQSSIGDYFFALVLFWTTLSASLLAWRWKKLASEASFDSVMSREFVFLGNNWILVGMVFVIFWGTLFPKIKELFGGDKVSVGPPWFNKYMVPLTIVLLLLMAVGTLISWKKSSWKNFQRNFTIPIVGTLVGTPLLVAGYWFLRAKNLDVTLVPKEAGLSLGAASMCVFVFMSISLEYWRGLSARIKSTGEGMVDALLGLFERQRRRYGGYLVHLGFILVIMAFCGNAFKIEQDVSLEQGDSIPLGDYEVRYDGLSDFEDDNKSMILADLVILKDGKEVARVDPGRAQFHSFPDSPTSEVSIHSTPVEDLYFALAGFSQGGQQASFKMIVSPLTWWFWFGGSVVIFGTILCMWPQEVKVAAPVFRQAAATVASVLLLGLAAGSPVLVWSSITHADESDVHAPGKAEVTVHDPRLKRLMHMIRVDCPSSGRPTMANSSPTCSDYQQDMQALQRLLREGKTDEQILQYFVDLRGDWVLADPGNEEGNYWSWLLPLGALGVAAPLIFWKVRGWVQVTQERERKATAAPEESAQEDAEYKDMLRKELAEL